jgi:hypothetical protein
MLAKNLYFSLLIGCLFALPADAAPADTVFSFFGGQQSDNGILISFTIKGGVTCQGVQIKHSTDGSTFTEIHEFVGVCGNPSFDESYYYTHGSPRANGINYYRIDLGSLGISSDVIKVEYIGYNDEGYHIFPNPVNESSTIYFTNPGHTLHQYVIVSSTGQVVFTGETTDDRINIPGTEYAPGVYRFVVYRLSERRFSGQFVRIE